MLKSVLSILPLLAVAACINYSGRQDIASTPAPSFEQMKAEIDAGICNSSTGQYSFGLPTQTAERPAPLSGCPAYFPRHFLNMTVLAGCGSMFDLDDAGRVINLETRCNIDSPRVNVPEAWEHAAQQGFAYSISKQLDTWRYPVKGKERRSQRRHSIFLSNIFGIDQFAFVPKAYPPFQRPAPAPPLPPDLVEKIAKYAADS